MYLVPTLATTREDVRGPATGAHLTRRTAHGAYRHKAPSHGTHVQHKCRRVHRHVSCSCVHTRVRVQVHDATGHPHMHMSTHT